MGEMDYVAHKCLFISCPGLSIGLNGQGSPRETAEKLVRPLTQGREQLRIREGGSNDAGSEPTLIQEHLRFKFLSLSP